MFKTAKNAVVSFERPIDVGEGIIYGILIHAKNGQISPDTMEDITDFIGYLVGVETFLKNGGNISAGVVWTLPDKLHSFAYNHLFERVLITLMKNQVGFQTMVVDTPIDYYEDEVDEEPGDPCFIIKMELIDRLTSN